MSTNNKDMGDFDDVVMEIELKNGEQHVFALQLKHIVRPIAQVHLVTNNKKFSLKKYSKEFKKVKTNYDKSQSYSAAFQNFHFILFSNSVLEKHEKIGEDWTKLEPIADGKKIDSDILIRKFDDCFEKKILNFGETDSGINYKIKRDKEGSPDEEFFNQFSFYTKQKTAKETESLISDTILNTFKNCKSSVVIKYLNYFSYWCRRDFGAFKITKQDVRTKLAELLLAPHIPEPNIEELQSLPEDKNLLLLEIFLRFDMVVLEKPSDVVLNRIWSTFIQEFLNKSKEWNKPISGLYMGLVKDIVDLPISALSENFNEISLKKIYLILWQKDILPLILKVPKDAPEQQHILQAIKLCETKGRKKKFLLLEETNLEDTSDWTIFRNLSDLNSASSFYNFVTEQMSVSVQGRPSILLKELLQIDESLVNSITMEEIVLILEGNFLIGDDSKKHFPRYYVQRQVPKILMNNETIDQLDDVFVVSYFGDVESIHTNFSVNTVDISKYLLLKPQRGSTSYKPKQFLASYLVNIEKKEQVMNSKFIILAKGGCPKGQFHEICLMNSTKNCHHVHFYDNQRFEWIESRGSTSEIQNYQLNSKELKSEDFVQDADVFTHFDNKINVICADPGMGKSIMMKFLKFNCPSSFWVVMVNLSEHTGFFKKKHNVQEILTYFLRIEGRNALAEHVVTLLSSKKQLIFLWDGFDELPKESIEGVISAVKNLALEGYSQWLSARSNSKNFLQETFQTLALTITQFSQQNQYEYVHTHLTDKYEDEKKVQDVIGKMDENIRTSLNCGYFDYTGIPLQIHMVVEIYLRQPVDQIDNVLVITLTDMYEKFIKGRFDTMFEKAEADPENYYMQQIREQYVNVQLPLYEIAAVKASFEEELLRNLNLNCDELLNELEESEDSLGLIVGINDEKKLIFAHKTYEEFLAASWLARNCHIHTDLVAALFQEKHTNIRLMFDMILAKDSPVHLAVLYRNLDVLAMNEDQIENCMDNAGRNPLHIACSWGRKYPVIEVMENSSEELNVERSSEINQQKFLDLIQFLKQTNPNISNIEGILTCPKSFDAVDKYYNNLYQQVGEPYILDNNSETVTICAETLVKVDEEDTNYLEIVSFLLDHKCKPLEVDQLLSWNAFHYADKTLSLAAINLMLKRVQMNRELLKNYNHIPTLLHYFVGFLYDELFELVDEVPYIQYKYQYGNLSLLQLATETNNLHAVSKLLQYNCYKDVINMQSAFSGNPLSSATFHGNLEMIDVLLENGCKVNGHKTPPVFGAVFGNKIQCYEKLLKAGADVNALSDDGNSPLIMATMLNQKEIVTQFLQNGADVNYANEEFTALDHALKHGVELVQLFLKYKPNLNRQSPDLGYTTLHFACEYGNLDIIKCLLEHGADTKIKSKDLLTPLLVALVNSNKEIALELIEADPSVINDCMHENSSKLSPMIVAVKENFDEVIRALIKHGAHLYNDECDTTPLHIAVAKGLDSIVTTLIEVGASVNRPDANGELPLCFAALKNVTIVKILLDNSADVNAKNKSAVTALHLAALRGKLDSVEELVNRGANMDAVDETNLTPLLYSIREKHPEVTKFLLEKGASVDDGEELLCQAARSDLPECIVLLLERGVSVNAKDSSGKTALNYASYNGNSCVKVLLEKGANPNSVSSVEESPIMLPLIFAKTDTIKELINAGTDLTFNSMNALHVAVFLGDIFSTVFLIRRGVDVNVVTENAGETPLHYVCGSNVKTTIIKTLLASKHYNVCVNYNAEDCARELLANGADVNRKDIYGLSPLHVACREGENGLVKLFIEHGADVNALTNEKITALHACYAFENLEGGDILLENGADLNAIDAWGKTPLSFGMDQVHTKGFDDLILLDKLIKLGANIDSPDQDGFTLLHKACKEGNSEAVDYLLRNGANVETITNQGSTPIFYACDGLHEKIVVMLLDRKCTVNVQNPDGNTPLHFAALKGDELIMTLLLEAGSDANIQNNNKFTPLHLTCQFGEYIKSKILLKAGAKINQKGSKSKSLKTHFHHILYYFILDYAPLHFAISSKNTDLVQLLIRQGANIDQASLYSAVHIADLELVMLLLSQNHSFNLNTENLIEALLNAESRNLDLLNYLLRKGSDPNSLCGPLTNLALACKVDCLGYVECLLQHGANVNACGPTGTTPLMSTCFNKHLRIANLLVNSGVDVNQKDDQGWNAFFYACSNGNLDLVKFLHKKGTNIFLENRIRSTALMEASQHTPIIRYLVDNGLNVNHKNNDNCTPLFNACLHDNCEGALYLIENGAEINAVAKSQRLTPLHGASIMGHAEMVKLLLFFNADVTIKSTSGNTPLLSAVGNNKLEVVKLFADLLTNAETSGNDYGITNRSTTPLLKLIKVLIYLLLLR
jgi:ankyrin repeat protein